MALILAGVNDPVSAELLVNEASKQASKLLIGSIVWLGKGANAPSARSASMYDWISVPSAHGNEDALPATDDVADTTSR